MSQQTLTQFETGGTVEPRGRTIEQRKEALLWTPDNPDTGATPPEMYSPAVTEYFKNPGELPYSIPAECGKGAARNKHRTWYWLEHRFDQFECPDCGRPPEKVHYIEVHHIDENPLNGDPDNLVALCKRCHRGRHRSTGAPWYHVDEWKDKFRSYLAEGNEV